MHAVDVAELGPESAFNLPNDDVGSLGVPNTGMQVKLVPLAKAVDAPRSRIVDTTLPGYLHRPDLTQAAFDDEGFYSLGDAVRVVVPPEPRCGPALRRAASRTSSS